MMICNSFFVDLQTALIVAMNQYSFKVKSSIFHIKVNLRPEILFLSSIDFVPRGGISVLVASAAGSIVAEIGVTEITARSATKSSLRSSSTAESSIEASWRSAESSALKSSSPTPPAVKTSPSTTSATPASPIGWHLYPNLGAHEISAIQVRHCQSGILLILKLNKSKAWRVEGHPDTLQFPILRKLYFEIFFFNILKNVSHIYSIAGWSFPRLVSCIPFITLIIRCHSWTWKCKVYITSSTYEYIWIHETFPMNCKMAAKKIDEVDDVTTNNLDDISYFF